MKRGPSAFLWGGSNKCPNPQHSKPFWTSVNRPRPSSPAIPLLVKQNQNNLFVPFQTQTDEGSRENERRKTASMSQPSPTVGETCLMPTCILVRGAKSRSTVQQLGSAPAEVASYAHRRHLLFWTAEEGKQQDLLQNNLPQTGIAITCVGTTQHVNAFLLCTFPHCLPSSQQQLAILQTSFSRISNWWTKTRCPLT